MVVQHVAGKLQLVPLVSVFRLFATMPPTEALDDLLRALERSHARLPLLPFLLGCTLTLLGGLVVYLLWERQQQRHERQKAVAGLHQLSPAPLAQLFGGVSVQASLGTPLSCSQPGSSMRLLGAGLRRRVSGACAGGCRSMRGAPR